MPVCLKLRGIAWSAFALARDKTGSRIATEGDDGNYHEQFDQREGANWFALAGLPHRVPSMTRQMADFVQNNYCGRGLGYLDGVLDVGSAVYDRRTF